MVKKINSLSLSELYPEALTDFNLNTCADPDCGSFGVPPDFSIPLFKAGMSSIRIPGTNETIEVPKLASTSPTIRKPAMRLGADPAKPNGQARKAPDPGRVLYRPWLFHGTPLWRKFEDR